MEIRVLMRQTHRRLIPCTPDRSGSLRVIWWNMVGRVVRICVRVTDSVQRVIKAATISALERALQTLVNAGKMHPQDADEVRLEVLRSLENDSRGYPVMVH
jgi:gamma-glutamyl:cysteine ligase YbdK (ATP-grasp superfamily)